MRGFAMHPMSTGPNTPEQRQHRRRIRRIKRRLRIFGPFLAVPILLATLALSVDLVEYQPTEEPDRLSDRPIRIEKAKDARRAPQPSYISTIPVTSATPAPGDLAIAKDAPIGREFVGLDLELPDTDSLQPPPTPPESVGRQH